LAILIKTRVLIDVLTQPGNSRKKQNKSGNTDVPNEWKISENPGLSRDDEPCVYWGSSKKIPWQKARVLSWGTRIRTLK